MKFVRFVNFDCFMFVFLGEGGGGLLFSWFLGGFENRNKFLCISCTLNINWETMNEIHWQKQI